MLNTQPWLLVLHRDHLEVRADRSRLVAGLDPTGRALVHSVGQALLNARVALAARGWAVRVDRLPVPEQPDLLARVHPVEGEPDPALSRLAPAVRRLQSGLDLPPTGAEDAPSEAGLRALAAAVVDEGAVLFPVLTDELHRLVARLTQRAAASQQNDPVVLTSVRHWTHRPGATGDGVPTPRPEDGSGASSGTGGDADADAGRAGHPHRRPAGAAAVGRSPATGAAGGRPVGLGRDTGPACPGARADPGGPAGRPHLGHLAAESAADHPTDVLDGHDEAPALRRRPQQHAALGSVAGDHRPPGGRPGARVLGHPTRVRRVVSDGRGGTSLGGTTG